jgi:uncharacterized protein (TIGR02444 family)
MTTFSAHPAWDFVTRLHAAQGVAPACLGLQERHGIDVTFMLFCLWRGSVSAKPLGAHMPALAATAREWHEAVVLPLRTARRRLKAEAIASPRPEARALYKTVMAAEIDCEHAELLMLAERAETLCGSPEDVGSPEATAENLSAFLAAVGVTPTEQDRPALSAILAAAGAA